MRLSVLSAALLLATAANAREGMWVPQQLPEIAGPLKEAGLRLPPEQLANLTGAPMGAVVALGGCTASFISPDGLVATNHHCAYGAIQLNSTPEKNLMATGFYAPQRAQEVSAGPNARVFVLDDIRDVTAEVKAKADAAPEGLARQQAIEDAQKALVAACESEPGYRCTLFSFFSGQTYRLFRNLEIKDVRLVYAPPGSVGNYGGEVDNWMWPRHTGDFSFYRAYVGKDGKPAAFAADNVPYRPKHWLRLADEALRAGDFVMVAGYPGSTNRYALASEFDNVASWQYPVVGQHLRDVVALVEAAGKSNPDIEVKYAATIRSWQNAMKNWSGQLEGFARSGAAANKRADEERVLAWLRAQGNAGKAALDAHARISAIVAETVATRERDLILGQIGSTGLFGQVRSLYRFAVERSKPDAQRSPGFQDRDLATMEGGVRQLDRRFVPAMEQQLLAYWLDRYVKLPKDQRVPALDAFLGGDSPEAIRAALAKMYDGTGMGNTDARLAVLKAEQSVFEASADPMVRLARELYPFFKTLEDTARTRAGISSQFRPQYLAGVQAYRRSLGQNVYPDANLSLRITYGNVMGYVPRDGVAYTPFTTLEGALAKATSEEPFDMPQAQREATRGKRYGAQVDSALGTVPVNFLSDLDITGGNSGSPVLNGDGELVGLAFDGNWESVSSNWIYEGDINRMIAVDSRYMLWTMEQVFPAPEILQELRAAQTR